MDSRGSLGARGSLYGPGIVAIRQHCCTKASLPSASRGSRRRVSATSRICQWSRVMTNVGQAATAELAAAATAAPGRLARLLGVIAVALALLSALATFLVLANLTPIRADPRGRHRASCSATRSRSLLLLGDHRLGNLAGGPGAPARPRGLAAACAHRRAVFDHRRGAGDPGGRGRERHARPRARPAVLRTDRAHDRERADRGGGLSARAGPDRARRHHRGRDRAHARQADVRREPRGVPQVRQLPGRRPRASGDHRVRPRRQRGRPGRREGREPELHQAVAAGARRPSTRKSRRSACSSTTIMSRA